MIILQKKPQKCFQLSMDSEINHELYKVTPWVNAVGFLFSYKNKKGKN